MRKILSLAFLALVFSLGSAQELDILHTPAHEDAKANSRLYQDQVDAFYSYWEGKDHTTRGSGYKQMHRWMELWKHEVKEDGTLPSAFELADSWKEILNWRLQANPLNDDSNWTSVGPFTYTNQGSWSSGQGRVNVTLVDPNNPNRIYIGAPDGGLWVSNNHGTSWEPLTLYLPSIGVSGIAVDYNNSNTIYITTGDEDAGDSYSVGVYKSTDGGQTWNEAGTTITNTNALMGEIYIHPTNSNILWAISSQGLYKTTDAGANWTNTFPGNVKEIRLKPGDPNTIYIVYRPNGSTTSIQKSTDGGVTFTEIRNIPSSGRTGIDVTAANPEYIYVLVSNQNDTFKHVLRSTDSGATFEIRNSTTDLYDGSQQAWFDLAIAASDTNAETVFVGTLNVWKSTNGGTSWVRGATWSNPQAPNYTHADIHDIKFFNDKLYVGSDGGIYVSEDYGATFTDYTKNGLNIGQFYRIDVAPETSSKIVGGLQDNGGYAFVDNSWINYHGADGMDAAINPTNSNHYYGFIQFGGGLYRFNAAIPNGNGVLAANGPESGNWVTPLEYGSTNVLYAGYSRLYRSTGGAFTLSSTNTFTPKLDHIRVDPNDDKRVMVANSQRIFLAQNQDAYPLTFEQLAVPAGGFGGQITGIEFNQDNTNIIYVTTATRVFKSEDSGQTWTNITRNLPTSQTKYAIAHQKGSSNNTVYVATRNAVFYTNDNLDEWVLFNANLPHARITDIEVNSVEGHVVISTYGRGVWRSPVTQSSLAVDEVGPNDNSAMIYPNPVVNGQARLSMLIEEPAKFTVYSIDGKLVKEKNYNRIDKNTNLDFTGLVKGTYVVTIHSEKHLIRKKVIIK
jgi:photosystem II stability/assembly factor-like uncharacterized protein